MAAWLRPLVPSCGSQPWCGPCHPPGHCLVPSLPFQPLPGSSLPRPATLVLWSCRTLSGGTVPLLGSILYRVHAFLGFVPLLGSWLCKAAQQASSETSHSVYLVSRGRCHPDGGLAFLPSRPAPLCTPPTSTVVLPFTCVQYTRQAGPFSSLQRAIQQSLLPCARGVASMSPFLPAFLVTAVYWATPPHSIRSMPFLTVCLQSAMHLPRGLDQHSCLRGTRPSARRAAPSTAC